MKMYLMELKKLLLQYGTRWKRWRGLVLAMSMVVVFVTTYALILPAITLEKDQGKPEQGVYLDSMENGSTAALDNGEESAQPDESASSAAGNQDQQAENTDDIAFSRGNQAGGLEEKEKNAEDKSDQGQKTAYAQGIYTGKGDGLTVSLDLKEEMRLPEDVKVYVEEIRENEVSMETAADYQACLTAARKAAVREKQEKITAIRFFKFALLSGDKEIRTAEDIDILIQPMEKDLVRKGELARVLAFHGSSASMVEDVKTQMSGYRVSAYRFIYPSIAGNSSWGLLGLAVTEPLAQDEEEKITSTGDAASIEKNTTMEEGVSSEQAAATETSASTEESAATTGPSSTSKANASTKEIVAETKQAATSETAASTEEPASSTKETSSSEAATEPEAASAETAEDGLRSASTLEYQGQGYKVVMTYDDKAGIPEGAALQVTEIQEDSEDYEKYLKEAAETLAMNKKTEPTARFFDIKIMSGDKEIEPASPVSVQISYDQPMKVKEGEKVDTLHFGEKKTEVLEHVEVKTNRRDNIEGVTFEADSFSVYGVVTYTVDFHYEIDGKTYEFSIPGGGFVSLEHLVEVLGIANTDTHSENGSESAESEAENSLQDGVEESDINNSVAYSAADLNAMEISEETRKFVADVESVEFSNPDLVWVGKVDNDSTVGGLKKANDLECEYSAELTQEQIDEINNTVVESGDWALVSVRPFLSEETLAVTMKNGEVFTVRVTDAQISRTIIAANGAAYEVTVTYGPDAMIPENSSLTVEELSENSEGYLSAWKLLTGRGYSENQSEAEDEDDITLGMQAYDISIYDENGNVVEPQSTVKVSFTLKSLPEDVEDDVLDSTLAIHHVDESAGEAVIETVAAINGTAGNMELEEESMKAEFFVDSFSTYAITWGSASNSSTQLQVRQNNNPRVSIPIYYVDTDGRPIKRPSSIGDTVRTTAESFPYTYAITADNLAREISGYTYQGAHANNYQGSEISSVQVTSQTSGWYYPTTTYTANPSSVYLVYSGQPSGITVHYGYMQGDTFVEFTEEEDGDVPAGTTVPKPSQYGDQWDLEKNIPGYRYVTTRLNDPTDGREISSLLNTDPPYKQGVNNTFENADQSAYPSYTSSTAPTSFVSEWRYRQLSKSDWNPTGAGWNYSASEPVSDQGVTKPVSFAETDEDIYVIYEAGSMSAGSGDGSTPDLGELNAPVTDKQVASNHDGTYDVTLSATSEKKNSEATTKANVVIVLDTSWSMYEKDAGNGQSRMVVAKSAIGSLADKLFALNEEESDTIELAFVNFAQRVRNEENMRTIYSGTDASSFKSMINGLNCASGTNWDDALYAADHIYFNDSDPTYVVFITDGDPISCAHPYGTYSDWDGGTYYDKTVRSNYQYALAAKNQADSIIGHNKTLYTIGAFGEIANLQAIGGTYLGQANDTDTINGYFDDIISDIQSALGYKDITINDGITALSSTGLARGDISSLRYYRSGGENSDGSEKYDHTANDGHGVVWTDAPDAYLLEVKSEGGET